MGYPAETGNRETSLASVKNDTDVVKKKKKKKTQRDRRRIEEGEEEELSLR